MGVAGATTAPGGRHRRFGVSPAALFLGLAALAGPAAAQSTQAAVEAAASLTAANSTKSFPVPEINSGILLVGPPDYEWFGGTFGSRCSQMVDKAATLKQSRILFTPTLFWVDDAFRDRKSVNSQGRISYFCYQRHMRDPDLPFDPAATATCTPADGAGADKFRAGMAACFKRAVDKGLAIHVAPHLDDGLGLGGWRNGLVFDPLARYGALSYAEFMLYPIADALNAAIGPNTRVSLALQGEMSATVFYFPASYSTLVPYIRNRILAGKPAAWAPNVEVGLSTNLNKLCGCVLQDLVDPSRYLTEFPAAFAAVKSRFDTAAIKALYDTSDFIGISNYASMSPDFAVKDLESATYQFATEAAFFGVDVKDLIFNKGTKLYWNEYGLGGGTSQDGRAKAVTARDAAATPFFGVSGRYSKAKDPWTLYDPATPNPVRDYLRYFYSKTIAYANAQGNCAGCEYRVDGIFLWNDASWDVQGIYPESTTGDGSYRDPVVVGMIEAHNEAVMRSKGGPSVTPSVPPPGWGQAPHADSLKAAQAAAGPAGGLPTPAATTLPGVVAAAAPAPAPAGAILAQGASQGPSGNLVAASVTAGGK